MLLEPALLRRRVYSTGTWSKVAGVEVEATSELIVRNCRSGEAWFCGDLGKMEYDVLVVGKHSKCEFV